MTDHAEALEASLHDQFRRYGNVILHGPEAEAYLAALAAYRSRPAAEVVGYASDYGMAKLAEKANHYCLSLNKRPEKEFHIPLYATPALAGTEPAGEVVEALSNLQRLWDEHCAAVDRYNTRLASERADGSIPKRMGDLYERMDDARHAWTTAMQDFVKERSAEKLVAALRDQSEA